MRAAHRPTLLASARRIAPLAWPVFVGQVAVLAFATIDTVLAARYGALDLAALAIGAAVYVTVFISMMGVVLAVGPIAGQLLGAGKTRECGRQLHQAMWLALALSVAGCALLLLPQPFLDFARTGPEVSAKVRGYLTALAFALPPALLFTAFRGFNTAMSRPKIVMVLQLGALALKVPLSALLVFGFAWSTPLGELRVAAQGAPGCGVATAIVMAGQMLAAWWVLRRDPFYAPFELGRGLQAPHRASLLAQLRLGIPMGLSIAIEVTGFTFMAFFIARFGPTPVGGHQIAANMAAMMFMMPLAIANATSTLVAQSVGAGDAADARRLGWHGLQAGLLIAVLLGAAVFVLRVPLVRLYLQDPVITGATLPLLAWVAVFHVADAAQTVVAFVLRAYHVAVVPLAIYAVAVWGIGLGGGALLAFNRGGWSPPALQGASGFWSAATLGLAVAASGMCLFLVWMLKQYRPRRAA